MGGKRWAFRCLIPAKYSPRRAFSSSGLRASGCKAKRRLNSSSGVAVLCVVVGMSVWVSAGVRLNSSSGAAVFWLFFRVVDGGVVWRERGGWCAACLYACGGSSRDATAISGVGLRMHACMSSDVV